MGAAATTASPDTAPEGNFVVNGTFDNGTTGWHGNKATKLSLASGETGGQAAALSNSSKTPRTVSLNDRKDSVAATVAGHTYRATADIKVHKPEQSAAIVLREWDHSADKAKQVGHVQNHDWVTSDGWQPISVDYTAETNGATLDLNLVAYNLTKGNTVTVDNVTLYDVTADEPVEEQPAGEETGPEVEPRPLPEVTPPPVTEPTPDDGSAPTTEPAPQTKPGNWNLVFSDEFNGTDVNRDNWKVLNNSTYGDGNNELACLMDRPENVSVGGGILKISAQLEETPLQCRTDDARFPNGRSYSSGFLDSKAKVAFEYGRFEVRAKTPNAHGDTKGLWPAFWLRPEVGGIGEIDIFEIIGTSPDEVDTSNKTTQSIHYDYVKTYPHQHKAYYLPEGNFADEFHTHAVEWEPGSLKFYVDDVLTFERNTTTTPWIDKAFSGKFHMKLNMAVGGNWTGSPDKYTSFPADYEVDYVRVYQR